VALVLLMALVAAALGAALGWRRLPELLAIFGLAAIGAYFAGRAIQTRVGLPASPLV
jgi:hypothetical protein